MSVVTFLKNAKFALCTVNRGHQWNALLADGVSAALKLAAFVMILL